MKLFAVLGMSLVIVACSSQETKSANTYRDSSDERPIVDPKYSLTKDREDMAAMRADVPEERKQNNDELAFTLSLLTDVTKEPSSIRQKFDSALRKKRDLFNKDMTKEREKFTKDERKKRETFLKSQSDSRQVFQRAKHTKEERTEFFNEQDSMRKEFFADLREKRNDYESDTRERRKNFEDYAREKSNEFNQEYRAFVKRREEWKKSMTTTTTTQPKTAASAYTMKMNSELEELERGLEEAKRKGSSSLGAGE
jgi:hypothetical protein